MYEIIIFLMMTAVSSSLSTLKNMFIARKQINATYVVVFFDALIFANIMKSISGGDGIVFAFAYAFGKLLGTYLGNKIEKKMALGIINVNISVNHLDKMISIADELRERGYTVETTSVYGYRGKRRYKIDVVMSRKEIDKLYEVLDRNGYSNPTMVIKDVSNILGKITVDNCD